MRFSDASEEQKSGRTGKAPAPDWSGGGAVRERWSGAEPRKAGLQTQLRPEQDKLANGENLYDWKKHFIELNQKDTDKYPYTGCYYKDIL